ncbi:MAG: J domain-containing protein [Ilumatobacteraceae bacterium]
MDRDPFATLGLTDGATAEEVRAARRRLAKQHHPDHGGDADRMQSLNVAAAAALARLGAGPVRSPRSDESPRQEPSGVRTDRSSFTVEALPVDTFEALLVVSSWLGEVLDDDPPYRLDVHLRGPVPCWCRLELVPDAGASTVGITVGAYDGARVPDVEAIRDVWVDQLNRLDWDEPFTKP